MLRNQIRLIKVLLLYLWISAPESHTENEVCFWESAWITFGNKVLFSIFNFPGPLSEYFIFIWVFRKKGVLRNFTKYRGKHICLSLFFNKVAVLKKRLWHRYFPGNFALKKRLWYRCFSCACCEISKKNFPIEQLRTTCFWFCLSWIDKIVSISNCLYSYIY